MIKVVVYKSGMRYYGFHVSGHAGYDESGKDIICAAVSSMTMLVINTLEVVLGCDVDYDIDENTADITRRTNAPSSGLYVSSSSAITRTSASNITVISA